MKINIVIKFLGNHLYDKKPYKTKFLGTESGIGQVNIYSINQLNKRKLIKWRKYEGYFGSKEESLEFSVPDDHKELYIEFKVLHGKFYAKALHDGEVIASID